MNARRLWAMSRKEIIQLRRDPRSLALAFILPLVLILFFGYAISLDVKNIAMGVLDLSQTAESRQLIDAFSSSGYFTLRERLARYGDAEEALGAGRVRLVLVIPPGFRRDLSAGRMAPVQLLLDGGDANSATIAQTYPTAKGTSLGLLNMWP